MRLISARRRAHRELVRPATVTSRITSTEVMVGLNENRPAMGLSGDTRADAQKVQVVLSPAARSIEIRSLGFTAAGYRNQQTVIMVTTLIGMAVVTLIGAAAALFATVGVAGATVFLVMVWLFLGVGWGMLGMVERRVCPHCSKFLPSTQPWRCPTCGTQHAPPKDPTMFDGCSKCHRHGV